VAQREPAWVPREFLDVPAEFGKVASPAHRRAVGLDEAGQLAASLAQHSAALVVQSYRDSGLTVRELAERLGQNEGYVSGQLTGRYPAGYDDLARWAIVLRDPSVLPVVDALGAIAPAEPSD
jgi:hypothetical protein